MITVTPKTHVEREVVPLAVNTATAAKMLSVSTRTVTKLADEGQIERKKIGWRNLFVVESLRRFLETSPSTPNQSK